MIPLHQMLNKKWYPNAKKHCAHICNHCLSHHHLTYKMSAFRMRALAVQYGFWTSHTKLICFETCTVFVTMFSVNETLVWISNWISHTNLVVLRGVSPIRIIRPSAQEAVGQFISLPRLRSIMNICSNICFAIRISFFLYLNLEFWLYCDVWIKKYSLHCFIHRPKKYTPWFYLREWKEPSGNVVLVSWSLHPGQQSVRTLRPLATLFSIIELLM